ncbi:MAG: hypothetical protein FGM52_05095 [Mycobacterium sp.]|nr:hypothetical protein [Mycobacterium sp.]
MVLVPADEDALELGVGAAAEPGMLTACLTVTTAGLGQFEIPLTARQLGLLAVVSKQLLALDANDVARLRDQLNTHNIERNDND